MPDTRQLPPQYVSVLLLLARIWDGFSDPIVGYLISKTNTRFGRLRPWYASTWQRGNDMLQGLCVHLDLPWRVPAVLAGAACRCVPRCGGLRNTAQTRG